MNLRDILRSRKQPGADTAAIDAFFAWADEPAMPASDLLGSGLSDAFSRVQSNLAMEKVVMDQSRKDALWHTLMASEATEGGERSAPASAPSGVQRRFAWGDRGSDDSGSRTRRSLVIAFNALLILAVILGTTRWVQNRQSSPPELPAYIQAATTPRSGTPPSDAPVYGLFPDSGCLSESNTPVPSPWVNIPDLRSALSTPISEYVGAVQRGPAPDDASLTYAPATRASDQCGQSVLNAYAVTRGSFQRSGRIAPSQSTNRYIWEHDNPYLTPAEKASLADEQNAAIAQIIPAWNPVIARTEFDFDAIWNGPYSSIKDGTVYQLADGRYASIIYKRTGTTQVPGTTLVTGGNALIPYYIA
ncbi:MAG TPA: hypothetical protein VFQ54_13335, partial [Thermomicrobiales bacterium]|nr:hypothetical protein [Thermomicrobiales bacterium]